MGTSLLTSHWRRVFRLACVCLLLAPSAWADIRALSADLDGDGLHDRAAVDADEPTRVRVWLSTTSTIRVLQARRPILGLAAADLDGDHRSELLTSDAAAALHAWTHHGSHLRHFRAGGRRSAAPISFSRTVHASAPAPAVALVSSEHTDDLLGVPHGRRRQRFAACGRTIPATTAAVCGHAFPSSPSRPPPF